MKIKSVLWLVPVTAAMLAGCSGGSGNDVAEDAAVVDTQSGDTVVLQDAANTDTAGHDSTVADLPLTDETPSDVPVEDLPATDLPLSDVPTVDAVEDVPADTVEPVNIALNPMLSECGGFAPVVRAEEDSYCGDDRLIWSIDTENHWIHFTNVDVFLNCCGIHNVTVTYLEGVYVITEIDEPEEGGARCNCMCLFDFAVDMPLVDDNPVQVRIDRLVTDQGATALTAWEGEIDLSDGSGDILIDDYVGWCTEAVNIGQNPEFSACGGFQAQIPRLLELPALETLSWTFNAETGVVGFVDSDMCLNCCGTHSMSVFFVDGVYVLAEVDEPEGGSGRCFCDCIFDFAIELPGMTAGVIDVAITRDVTDSDLGAVQVWAGQIDLSASEGTIQIVSEATACI